MVQSYDFFREFGSYCHQRSGLCAVADLREIFCRNDKENRAGIRHAPTTKTAMAYSRC